MGGVLPVFQTPFNDDDSIDEATLEKELAWVFDQGSDGIVFAMVSEVLRLSEQERLSVAELACRVGRDRGTVVISAGAESTYSAVRFAIHAEDHGATAIMAIPPLSTDAPEEEVFGYYGALVAATSLPVIVQDQRLRWPPDIDSDSRRGSPKSSVTGSCSNRRHLPSANA